MSKTEEASHIWIPVLCGDGNDALGRESCLLFHFIRGQVDSFVANFVDRFGRLLNCFQCSSLRTVAVG